MEKEAQEDNAYRQQLEQERRDHELAILLAQESNGQVEDSPPLMRKYVLCLMYNVFEWKDHHLCIYMKFVFFGGRNVYFG